MNIFYCLRAVAFVAGSLWLAPVQADCGAAAPTPHCGSTPSLQFDAEGRLWAVFVSGEQVWLSSSRDLGEHWETAVAVNDSSEPIYADGENRPVLALDNTGGIFVAWTRRNAEAYSGDIRFARSLDGGASFGPVRTVNDDGLLTSHRFVSLTRTPSGVLYLAWLDKRDLVAAQAEGRDYVGAALYYTLSQDAGASFIVNRKVADNSCECCRIALAPDGKDTAAVFWRQVFDDGRVRDHAIAQLALDAAHNFARATQDDWQLDGCPHHGPALSVAEDGVHLAWFTNGTQQQGVVYGYRAAGAAQTTQVRVLDARPAGGHPVVHASGDQVQVLWTSYDGEAMRLLRAVSTDAGRRWQDAQVVLSTQGASDHPFILQLDEKVWAGWQTADEGLRLLPLQASVSSTQVEAGPKPFMAQSLKAIEAAHAGEAFLLVLWSVTCAPCFAELALLSQALAADPQLPIVLVATDPPAMRDEVEAVLADYNLLPYAGWQFAEAMAEKLRFHIDPDWYGELPRSYVYDAAHQRQGHSGALSAEQLQHWLQTRELLQLDGRPLHH